MAQYGKNFYGASYYGRRGTFGGQYTSEEISSGNTLTGALTNTIVAILPTSTYTPEDAVFIFSGTTLPLTIDSNSYIGINTGDYVNVELTGNDLTINYLAKADGGTMGIEVSTFIDGVQVGTTYTQSVDTIGSGEQSVSISNLPFGEQMIKITATVSPVYIKNITARTSDVSIEVRSKVGEAGTWSVWSLLTTTKTPVDGLYNGFTITGTTPDFVNKDFYQFRLMLGTSDNETTPIVRSCEFQRATSNNFSTTGQFRIRVDLEDVQSIDDLSYTATVPNGSKLYIRTRTIATEPFVASNWSSWSAPYFMNRKRFRIKSYSALQVNNSISEYLITPVINPQDPSHFITLQSWISFVAQQYVTDQNTNIRYQVLDKDLNRVTYKDGTYTGLPDGLERYVEFTATSDLPDIFDLSMLKASPIRLKIVLNRSQGALSSPVVDLVTYHAIAKYKELKEFSSTGFKAYASPVYGNNTGVIDLTFNDTEIVGDGTVAKPSNLGFTIPTPIGGTVQIIPDYTIDTNSETFGVYRAGEELNLYWKSQSGLVNKNLATTDANDIIVAKATAWPDNTLTKAEARLFKYYQYGRGFIIHPDVVTLKMTNIFMPTLDTSLGQYSYYVANGWLNAAGSTDINNNIIVSWVSNGSSNISNISEVNGSRLGNTLYNDSIKVIVDIAKTQGVVPWVSDEKIFEGVVNEDGKYHEKIISIEGLDIPEIDPAVSIGENPYTVDIVYRSVQSGGKIVPEEHVKVPLLGSNGEPQTDSDGHIIYEYPKVFYGDDSFEEVTKYRAQVLRDPSSATDYIDVLPDPRITDVLGIYFDSLGANPDNPADSAASFYVEGQDFQVVGNHIDWSIAYDETGTLKAGCAVPAADSFYYVTYKYNAVKKIYISFRCQYKEFETSKALWTSSITKEYTGTCSPGHDYRSSTLPAKLDEVTWGKIPANVDKETLFYVLNDDNMWVSTFLDDNTIVGTLRNRVPSVNWFPTIHNGYYYLGKDEYYLFTEPKEFTPTRSEVETATNAKYVPGRYGNGIFIEEGTTNIILNSGFDTLGIKAVVFHDSLSRTV